MDSEDYWEYDVQTAMAKLVQASDALPPDSSEGAGVFDLPNDTNLFLVSPSGNQVIFASERNLDPTSTVGPGEAWGLAMPKYEIFMLEQSADVPRSLGKVEGAVESFTWLPGEREVLVHVSSRLPNTATLWLSSLDKQAVTPLLSTGDGEPEAVFRALSPSGSLILYSKGTELHLYNLDSGTVERTSVPPISGRAYYWFVDERILLIVDDLDQPLDFEVLVFDLDQGRACRQYDETLRVHSIELSPNNRYLAVRWDSTRALYLLPIDIQCSEK